MSKMGTKRWWQVRTHWEQTRAGGIEWKWTQFRHKQTGKRSNKKTNDFIHWTTPSSYAPQSDKLREWYSDKVIQSMPSNLSNKYRCHPILRTKSWCILVVRLMPWRHLLLTAVLLHRVLLCGHTPITIPTIFIMLWLSRVLLLDIHLLLLLQHGPLLLL